MVIAAQTRGQSVDLVIYGVCTQYVFFAATAFNFIFIISFLTVPEETRSNITELLSERRQGRHDEAVTLMYHELACIARVRQDFAIQTV